jgi:hypothetical protein
VYYKMQNIYYKNELFDFYNFSIETITIHAIPFVITKSNTTNIYVQVLHSVFVLVEGLN